MSATPAPDADSEAAGFVLAGGRSSRMGTDKALVLFDGKPMVAHALATLRKAGLTASLAGGSAALAGLAPLIEDLGPGLGPLSGICAAMAEKPARWSVFIPVDMPLLPASLVGRLLRHAQSTGRAVTVASVGGSVQTLPVVLARAALPALQAQLNAGRLRCISAFEAAAQGLGQPLTIVSVEMLAQAGQVDDPRGAPPCRWFLNLNNADELRRAEVHRKRIIA